jgi:hypothetical protein
MKTILVRLGALSSDLFLSTSEVIHCKIMWYGGISDSSSVFRPEVVGVVNHPFIHFVLFNIAHH